MLNPKAGGTPKALTRLALLGVAARAAGTTAQNAVIYLDMAVRGRPSRSTALTV